MCNATELQIFGLKSRVLADSRQHAWPDFFAIVESEHKIRPALAGERPM
jgi:hypothetical protein